MASFTPKVSVILPVYQKNNEYLDLSVESILGQSLKEFELIIIANNCDEKLWESLHLPQWDYCFCVPDSE